MKYFLIFLFCLLSFLGYSQYPTVQFLGAPKTLVLTKGGLQADSSLILPVFTDTSVANLSPYIKAYPGNIIRVADKIWVRNSNATAWISLSVAASNGLTKVSNDIKLGGSLTQNTTISGTQKELKLDSIDFEIRDDSLYRRFNVTNNGINSGQKENYLGVLYSRDINLDPIPKHEIWISQTPETGNLIEAKGYRQETNSYIRVDTGIIKIEVPDANLQIDGIQPPPIGAPVIRPLVYDPNTDVVHQWSDPYNWNVDTSLYVKYTDTAGMLQPYLEAIDTVNLRRVKYVGVTMPSAFNVVGSPITDSGTIAVTGAGTASQYVRGDGVLASFPTATTGGGASVSYYLNGSVNKGTFGGQTYYEMSRTAITGAGSDFTRTNAQGDGLIAQFITDTITNLLIPSGNWNLELYFNASSGGGTPSFYVELYKYDGANFTFISSNSTSPELIALGTTINPYFCALAVPETILSGTDRLAIRVFVTTSGRSITLHTENSHLCQIITTFTTGLTAINGLTKQVQYFATGTSGTDFNISSSNDTHTFNLPTSSATNRGALSSTDWTTFNGKLNPSDTTSLSNRINTKLNISDTSAMLAPYARTNSIVAGWSLLGNSGTNATTNFLGTTDNVNLVFRRNNVISATIDSTSEFTGGNGGRTNFGFRTTGTGTNTTAFGYKALQNASGSSNTAVGNRAGLNVTSGNGNVFVGSNAGVNISNNSYNTAIGEAALGGATGSNNTAIGWNALNGTSSGNSNIGIGLAAGFFNSTGSNQIFINSLGRFNYSGDQNGSPFYAQQNTTIANQIVTLNGRVGINTISPSASAGLQVESTTQGFLQPRLTTTQMNAISTPATGLSVFNTTDSVEYTYRGTGGGWSSNVMTTGNQTINGQKIFNDIAFVGIGIRGNQSSGGNIYIDGSRSLDGTINYRATTHNMSGNLTGVATATVSTLNVNGGANTVSTITGASGVTSFRIQNTKSGGGTWYFENNRNAAAGSLEITNDIFTPAFTIFPSRNVSIGSNTEVASARLNVESTTQGFMPPRMTTSQRDLISSPAAGLIIYNTTTNKHQGYDGTTWNDFY